MQELCKKKNNANNRKKEKEKLLKNLKDKELD